MHVRVFPCTPAAAAPIESMIILSIGAAAAAGGLPRDIFLMGAAAAAGADKGTIGLGFEHWNIGTLEHWNI